MTENEMLKIAVHCLGVQAEQEVCEECDIYGNCHTDCKDVAVVAISALKEIQQYREIGTVEECREAVEKQKAKKRIYPKTALERYHHAPECPNCKRELKPQICGYTLSQAIGIYSYCPWCGQAIDENLEVE